MELINIVMESITAGYNYNWEVLSAEMLIDFKAGFKQDYIDEQAEKY